MSYIYILQKEIKTTLENNMHFIVNNLQNKQNENKNIFHIYATVHKIITTSIGTSRTSMTVISSILSIVVTFVSVPRMHFESYRIVSGGLANL